MWCDKLKYSLANQLYNATSSFTRISMVGEYGPPPPQTGGGSAGPPRKICVKTDLRKVDSKTVLKFFLLTYLKYYTQ